MKIERTKNASRNILFGELQRIYQIAIPFLIRTAMIYFMGVQYLGLDSLFVSILQVLNLAELGVGNAMVYSMYKPITEDNTARICALLKLYKLYYRIIGLVLAIVGIALLPVIPYLIKTDLPDKLNIYILYLINLGATVLSYWLFAYKNSLLAAHQRIDIASKITLMTNTIRYLLQFLVLIFVKDYYAYLIVILFTQIVNNLCTSLVANKIYPEFKAKGNLSKKEIQQINHRIRDLFTSKLGYVIVNSADTVVISAFLGLTMLAVYQNYYFIVTAIIGVISVFFSACTAGIGNSIIIESKEKNFKDIQKFAFLIAWISGFCACCFLCLFQPFMEIWVGKELMLDFSAVICFSIYFFVFEINSLLNLYKDAAGIWHEDRLRPLVTALTNLILNLIMVQFWGIYGVLLSTVLSMLIVGMPWLLHNLFTCVFEVKYMKPFLKKLLIYTFVALMTCIITYYICSRFVFGAAVVDVIVRFAICIVIPNIIFLLAYHKLPEFAEAILLANMMTKGKLKLDRFIKH